MAAVRQEVVPYALTQQYELAQQLSNPLSYRGLLIPGILISPASPTPPRGLHVTTATPLFHRSSYGDVVGGLILKNLRGLRFPLMELLEVVAHEVADIQR